MGPYPKLRCGVTLEHWCNHMKVDPKKAWDQYQRGPGFWASRALKGTRAEYDDLFEPLVVIEETPQGKKEKTTDWSEASIVHFIGVFGEDNIELAMLNITSRTKKSSYLLRVAHFFYYLGRRHERQFFK